MTLQERINEHMLSFYPISFILINKVLVSIGRLAFDGYFGAEDNKKIYFMAMLTHIGMLWLMVWLYS